MISGLPPSTLFEHDLGPSDPPGPDTVLFDRLRGGDDDAGNELFERFYLELRDLAGKLMSRQPAEHSLQATALVGEAYLRLFRKGDVSWNDKVHFLKSSARAMRHILVEHARAKETIRRRPPGDRVLLETLRIACEERGGNLVELDVAIESLGAKDPALVELIELRFFAGHSLEQAGEILGWTPRTVARRWQVAKLFLRKELRS